MSRIHEILKQYWGYSIFRTLQEEIIQSVLTGHDTLALLPTGGGKSICFQVPAMALDGICIVISPLIALMKDQVENLKKRGIPAVAIYSGMNRREIDITLDNCVYGQIKFLYVSPERIRTDIFIERLKRMKVSIIAIDEAHCISQWGYDFRPPYLQIAKLREWAPSAPMIALTATATGEVSQDIMEKLEFRDSRVFQKSFARANLSYSTFEEENKDKKLLQILHNVTGTAIIYVRSRKRTQDIAQFLIRQGIRAEYYHAGLSNQARSTKQDDWIHNRRRVMVATNAFGMGIDKPDVRVVIHMDLPSNLESYYQEAGRAGRDEKKAYAVALYNKSDLEDLRSRVEIAYPSEQFLRQVYQSLANYYQIAVGSGYLASYDFDLDHFQKTYNLPAIETYHALKRLEDEGFIQLNEAFYSPSKVYFSLDKKGLYEFQVANATYDPIIKLVLRLYGGELFSNFMPVSEQSIASHLQIDKATVERLLFALHQLNVIVYDKQKDKPQLTFTTVRHDSSLLPLDIKQLNFRRQRDLQKAESVIRYVSHPSRCRTLLLLEYFGEFSDEDCGVCDNCVRKKKQKDYSDSYDTHRLRILEVLTHQEMTLQQLLLRVKPVDENKMIEALREMAGTGEIVLHENGNVSRSR
jgi:ATP-dependent DNA helicase RecQ